MLTYLVSEFDGGGTSVGLGVGVVCVQRHLYRGIKFIHAHHHLAVREQRRDNA